MKILFPNTSTFAVSDAKIQFHIEKSDHLIGPTYAKP